MNRQRVIILLACAYFVLQVITISCWYTFGTEETHVTDMLICVAATIIVGALDVGVVRYLFQAMRRSESAYASDVSSLLTSSLERYRIQSSQEEQLMRQLGDEIERELTMARAALAAGDFGQLDSHMRASLDAASTTRGPLCDNATVAAILESKTRECAEAGVTLTPNVVLPEYLDIQDIELAAVLFNLIDNALHECVALIEEGRESEPEISVFGRVQAGQLVLKVENPCRRGVNVTRKAAARMKETALFHGWGTHIVSSIAASYGGIAEFCEKDGLFTASVMIPLRTED